MALNTLQEGGDGEVHSLFIVHVILELLLQVLPQLLALLANGVGFPLLVGTRGLGLEESRLAFPEASEEAGDTVRTYTTLLSRLLLYFSYHASYVLDIRGVFVSEPETLALKTSLVNQNTSISLESREGHGQVVVNLLNFTNGLGVL